jgi:hypothetical protein
MTTNDTMHGYTMTSGRDFAPGAQTHQRRRAMALRDDSASARAGAPGGVRCDAHAPACTASSLSSALDPGSKENVRTALSSLPSLQGHGRPTVPVTEQKSAPPDPRLASPADLALERRRLPLVAEVDQHIPGVCAGASCTPCRDVMRQSPSVHLDFERVREVDPILQELGVPPSLFRCFSADYTAERGKIALYVRECHRGTLQHAIDTGVVSFDNTHSPSGAAVELRFTPRERTLKLASDPAAADLRRCRTLREEKPV